MKFFLYLTLILPVIICFDDKLEIQKERKKEEEIENILDELKNDENLEQLHEDYFFFDRDKKKNEKSEDFEESSKGMNEKKSCYEIMHVKDNQIVHSKQSVENGAEFLDVKMIPLRTQEIVLQEKCMKICCETNGCDTSLLSLKSSEVGYRCYLFNCSSKCLFANHSDYSVMTKNSVLNNYVPLTTKKPENKPESKKIIFNFNINLQIELFLSEFNKK